MQEGNKYRVEEIKNSMFFWKGKFPVVKKNGVKEKNGVKCETGVYE